MKPGTKSYIFEEGGKLLSDVIRLAITRPHKQPPSESTIQPTSEIIHAKPTIRTDTTTPVSIHTSPIDTSKELDYRWECCACPGTLVITNPGVKNIETMECGDKVLTHTGNIATVSQPLNHHHVGDIYGLRTRYFNQTTWLTPTHPIYAIKTRPCIYNWRKFCSPCSCGWECPQYHKDYIPDWITPDKLQVYDLVILSIPQQVMDIKEISGISLDDNLLDLIGLYLAEGSVDRWATYWSYGKSESLLINETKVLIKRVFGIEPQIRETDTAINVDFRSIEIAKLFASNFGSHSYEKKLPQEFIFLPHYKQARITYNHWLGDGSRTQYYLQANTVSSTLALQLRMMLFRLKVISSLKIFPVGTRKSSTINDRLIEQKHTVYDLQISGSSMDGLCKIWGIPPEPKSKRQAQLGYFLNGNLLIPIVGIKKQYYDGEVYNCSVPGDESYTLANFTVHNCMKHLGGASILLREAYERAIDEGIGEGTAEKIMETLNEHSGMEADLEKMLNIPEAKAQAEKLMSGVRAFRKAAWEAKLTTGNGTKEDVADARLWNDILYQEAFSNAKSQPGAECIRQGM